MNKKIHVIKQNGERELFSSRKVYRSARRVGASKQLANKIVSEIEKGIYPNITTEKIFSKIKAILSKERPKSGIRFSLKKAMEKLGPTGFPFEKYVAEIFHRQGYNVKINQHLEGRCLKYEVDFLAQKNDVLYIGECKYRNLKEGLVDSRDTLVNQARFLDIQMGNYLRDKKHLQIKSILVTNSKFTHSAVRYANCVGTELLGWREPQNKGLEAIIEEKKLYPITILSSFKKDMAFCFQEKKLMLADDVLKMSSKKLSRYLNISQERAEQLRKEANILLNN
jgi:hypothetical protein